MSKKSKERKTTKLRRKTFKITQNYESDHIIMHCIDLTSKRSKLQTRSNYYQFAPIWRQNIKTIKNVELRRKTFKTTQNYESDQITTDCIDLMAKTSNQRKTTKVIILRWNCIDLTSKRSKQRKTTKRIKLRCIASIWHQNDQKCWVTSQNIQNNAKLQNWSNYNVLHRFDVKTIKNVELRRKTTKVIKLQITMNCIDLTSERSKMLSYVAKHSKLTRFETTKQRTSNYNELDRFDIKPSKMLSYVTKHSKQRKTTKVIKLQRIASIWCQKIKRTQNYKITS